jgi:hypothetical protein
VPPHDEWQYPQNNTGATLSGPHTILSAKITNFIKIHVGYDFKRKRSFNLCLIVRPKKYKISAWCKPVAIFPESHQQIEKQAYHM